MRFSGIAKLLFYEWSQAVAKSFSYSDAAKILGAPPKLLKLLDTASAVGLIGAVPVDPTTALSLFDARAEIVRTGEQIFATLNDRFGEARNLSQSEKLAAAHTILVVTAFFEMLDEADLPIPLDDLKVTKWEQVAVGSAGILDLRDSLMANLIAMNIPTPAPAKPYEVAREEIGLYYDGLASKFFSFASGLRAVSDLPYTDREIFRHSLATAAQLALVRYDENFRRLAADVPQFWIWANLAEHQATRELLRETADSNLRNLETLVESAEAMRTGLAGLEKLLSISRIGSADFARGAVAIASRSELDWPIVDSRTLNVQAGMQFPRLGVGYVNPSGKLCSVSGHCRPGDDSWWERISSTPDLQNFLASTSLITNSPVVILGQPGAGKSLLTRVLAARFSEAGFLTIRVELRHVTATASMQRQVEEAIYSLSGEETSWPDLVRSAGHTPRMILLDGLDELIQASGAEQTDYLQQVEKFQRREASLDRATSVIVASRTVVAARTAFPDSSIVMKLEPFTAAQVSLWLEHWSSTNRALQL